MANNFDTIAQNRSSEKFFLVRLEPARLVSDDLSLDSGTTYSTTFAFVPVSKVVVDGVEYTKVTTITADQQWTFDESTQLLTIRFDAVLTTQQAVAFFYLFFTQERAKQAPEDPLDTNTTTRVWSPRISESPPIINYDQRDILSGLLNYGSSSLGLKNQDSFFNQFLGPNDSFFNKEAIFWSGLDSVDNVQIAFRGRINDINVSQNVAVSFYDELSALDSTFFSNGTLLNSTFNETRFPSMNPIQFNLPIRKLFAETSFYKVIAEPTSDLFQLDKERLLEAVNIDYTPEVLNTNNRDWGTILGEGDFGAQSDTVSSVDNTNPNFTILTHGSGKEYRIGDTIKVDTEFVRVLDVNSGSDQISVTKNVVIVATDVITRPGITPVITQAEVAFYPLFDRDYNITTGGNNNIIEINFVNNFEATLGMTGLDPDADIVRFRAWADTAKDLRHSNVVQEILEEAGLTVNTASITAANAVTAVETNFYVPFVLDDTFFSFQTVIESILKGLPSFIGVNTDLELTYNVIDAPSSTDETTEREFLLNTLNINIDYRDLFFSITPTNDHDIIEVNFSNPVLESDRARFLHETTKNKDLNHVLADTSRIQTILDAISERRALYTFTTKTHNISDTIGDDLKLVSSKLLGTDSEVEATILGLNKTSDQVEVVADDLLGV